VEELVHFLVRGLVGNPDEVHVNVVEGEAVVMIELRVAASDVAQLNGQNGLYLRAIRQILSAASGRKKAVLELVEGDIARAEVEEPEAVAEE
jgi:uncharacterized protein